MTAEAGVAVPTAVALVAEEVAGAEAVVADVVSAGPKVAAATLAVEIAVVPEAGEREEYTVAIRTGNIISSDSVV